MDKLLEFIKRAKKVHGDRYDYNLVNYINNRTNVKIICEEHGVFKQIPFIHTGKQKSGCRKCLIEFQTKTNDNFIESAIKVHEDEYDYSLVDYKNNKIKVNIICKDHGNFKLTYREHITNKQKCPYCNGSKRNTEQFIKKCIKIHGDKYNYDGVNYINSRTKVDIICDNHGLFTQSPNSHLNGGKGCPICNHSKGENIIKQYLDKINIEYIEQKTFNKCEFKKELRFYFYLPNYNICIEYDGKQHFESIEYFGGDERFKKQLKCDEIKNKYCRNNNIKLIRIPYYNFKNINTILKRELFHIQNYINCFISSHNY